MKYLTFVNNDAKNIQARINQNDLKLCEVPFSMINFFQRFLQGGEDKIKVHAHQGGGGDKNLRPSEFPGGTRGLFQCQPAPGQLGIKFILEIIFIPFSVENTPNQICVTSPCFCAQRVSTS